MLKTLLRVCAGIVLFVSSIQSGEFDHRLFDSLLTRYVNEKGLVNYKGIKENHRLLEEYLQQLEMLNPEQFNNWSREEKMALWINAYNAITIEGIVRNYPIQKGNLINRLRFPQNSIRQISDFWDTVFIRVMGKKITLNRIEHEILREKFQDPRIHAVLVCAAMGCPLLQRYAFVPAKLDQQLDRASAAFINNPDKVKLDKDRNVLYLSSIFNWYRRDFRAPDREKEIFDGYDENIHGIIAFVANYLPEHERRYILKSKPEVGYSDYDWTLNEWK